MDSTIQSLPEPGSFVECNVCNCYPGFCSARERISRLLAEASLRKTFEGVGGNRVELEAPPKNRATRRKEKYLAKHGPPAKKRR